MTFPETLRPADQCSVLVHKTKVGLPGNSLLVTPTERWRNEVFVSFGIFQVY